MRDDTIVPLTQKTLQDYLCHIQKIFLTVVMLFESSLRQLSTNGRIALSPNALHYN